MRNAVTDPALYPVVMLAVLPTSAPTTDLAMWALEHQSISDLLAIDDGILPTIARFRFHYHHFLSETQGERLNRLHVGVGRGDRIPPGLTEQGL